MIRFFLSHFQDSKIHSTTKCSEAGFIFPVSVYWCTPEANISSEDSIMWPLKGLFQTTSSVWTYLLHPPGIKTSSVFICFNNLLTSSVMWASKVTQTNKRFLKENIPKTCLKNFKTSSSFIRPFEDDATTHRLFNSSFSAAASRLAPRNTIKSFSFVLSAFAVKHTLTLSFSFPVDLGSTSNFCRSGINRHIPNHVRLNGSFVHCNYTIWLKVCFH